MLQVLCCFNLLIGGCWRMQAGPQKSILTENFRIRFYCGRDLPETIWSFFKEKRVWPFLAFLILFLCKAGRIYFVWIWVVVFGFFFVNYFSQKEKRLNTENTIPCYIHNQSIQHSVCITHPVMKKGIFSGSMQLQDRMSNTSCYQNY